MKTIKGPILNLSLILAILLNLFSIYLLIANNFSIIDFVLSFLFFNILIYVFSYQDFNYIIYNTSKIVVKNQTNPFVEQVFEIENITMMIVKGAMYSTVLVIKLKSGKQKKVNISNLALRKVEDMITELSKRIN